MTLPRYEVYSRHFQFHQFHEANIPPFKRLCDAWASELPKDRLTKFAFGYTRPVDPLTPPYIRLTFATNDEALLDQFEALTKEIDPCTLL